MNILDTLKADAAALERKFQQELGEIRDKIRRLEHLGGMAEVPNTVAPESTQPAPTPGVAPPSPTAVPGDAPVEQPAPEAAPAEAAQSAPTSGTAAEPSAQ